MFLTKNNTKNCLTSVVKNGTMRTGNCKSQNFGKSWDSTNTWACRQICYQLNHLIINWDLRLRFECYKLILCSYRPLIVFRLNDEVIDLHNWLKPTAEEICLRHSIFNHIQHCLNKQYPEYKVGMFGSVVSFYSIYLIIEHMQEFVWESFSG